MNKKMMMDRQIVSREVVGVIAAALMLSAGCKRIGPDESMNTNPPIAFASVEAKATSAADIKNFDVWGTQTSTTAETPVPVTIFNGVEVSKTADELAWTYTDTRYWIPENYYQFWAIAPHSNSNVATVDGASGVMSMPYNIKDKHTVDLLYAADQREYSAPTLNATTVQLTFKHALSCINVKFVKGDSNAYTIKSVAISPVETEGKLAINSNSALASWSGQTAHTSLNFTDRIVPLNPPVEPDPNNENIAIFATGTFYALPQATTSISCTISYEVSRDGTTITQKTKSFDFITGGKWEGNYIYNYTILLQESYPIVIGDVYVVPWGEVNRGATIVIK